MNIDDYYVGATDNILLSLPLVETKFDYGWFSAVSMEPKN
jgi:hypothetical protein